MRLKPLFPRLSLAALLCACLLAGCSNDGLPTRAGNSVNFAKLGGKTVVINYWAQWCAPCKEEIPELNRLQDQQPNLLVLGVNFDDATGDELAAQIKAFDIRYDSLLSDPASLLGYARPTGLPTTVIIGPDGTVKRSLLGPQTYESLVKAAEL